MKIAVLLPNWVGDLAMATPAIRALRQRYASANLIAVLKPYLIELLAGSDWFDSLLPCEHQRWTGESGFAATVSSLRKFNPEIVLSFRGSFRAALMARASRADLRVGVYSPRFAQFWHRSHSPARDANGIIVESEVDRYLSTVELIGADANNRQLELKTTSRDEQLAEQFWRRMNLPESQRVVMINGGSAQSSAKLWPWERFAELAKTIVDHWHGWVVVNCGPGERETARKIVRLANRQQVVSLADESQLTFGLLKALLRRVRLLVSTDSGPRHLAAAVGTPVVAIFGSTDPRLTYNYHPQETIVRLPLPCSPCHQYRCPLGHLRCMRDLTLDQVLPAVALHLDQELVRSA